MLKPEQLKSLMRVSVKKSSATFVVLTFSNRMSHMLCLNETTSESEMVRVDSMEKILCDDIRNPQLPMSAVLDFFNDNHKKLENPDADMYAMLTDSVNGINQIRDEVQKMIDGVDLVEVKRRLQH